MPKQVKLDHKYTEKLAKIRQNNVQRHAGYENAQLLRRNIQKFQRNATYEMELQRLKSESVRPSLSQGGPLHLLEIDP